MECGTAPGWNERNWWMVSKRINRKNDMFWFLCIVIGIVLLVLFLKNNGGNEVSSAESGAHKGRCPYDSISEEDFGKLKYATEELFDFTEMMCNDMAIREEIKCAMDITEKNDTPWPTKKKIQVTRLLDVYRCVLQTGGHMERPDKCNLGAYLYASKMATNGDFSMQYEELERFYRTATDGITEMFDTARRANEALTVEKDDVVMAKIIEDINPTLCEQYLEHIKRFKEAMK